MKKRKRMNNYSSLKSKSIYFVRMNVSKEVIYEYGEGRYIQGYTEGYKIGVITGSLMTVLGMIVSVVILEIKNNK
jgi:hypothetical protein